ncbi:unnamed protein product, partial [Prorocentrum cordatum]
SSSLDGALPRAAVEDPAPAAHGGGGWGLAAPSRRPAAPGMMEMARLPHRDEPRARLGEPLAMPPPRAQMERPAGGAGSVPAAGAVCVSGERLRGVLLFLRRVRRLGQFRDRS